MRTSSEFKYIIFAIGLLLSSVVSQSGAFAQTYPYKPIHLIILYKGGIAEQLGRVYAAELEKELKQTIIVEIKPGEGGSIGTKYAAKADKDGYTLVIGSNGLDILAVVKPEKEFHSVRDLESITALMSQPFLLYVKSDSPIQNLSQYLAQAKADPDQLSYGIVGPNTPANLTAAFLNPYKEARTLRPIVIMDDQPSEIYPETQPIV